MRFYLSGFHKLLFSFVVMFFLEVVFAQSVTVDLIPAKDNTLYETADGSLSNGAGDFLFVGKTNSGTIRRAVFMFNIAGNIPAGATIESVSLTLNMSRTASNTARTTSLHKLTADWGEGTSNATGNEGGGAASSSGDVTWIHRFFDTDTWTTPGSDFNATASASQDIAGSNAYTWDSNTQLIADVQNWLDDPANNFGWILIGDESTSLTSKRFDSRENPTEANRPTLSVTYTAPTGIGDATAVPSTFELEQNFPNPFNPSTQIRFTLNRAGQTQLKVYNTLGQLISTLLNDRLPAGNYVVPFDGKSIASGIYFYQLKVNGLRQTRKMVLLR